MAQKQEISENLLRRIISQLEKAGILATTKGRNGGIQLGKSPESISVYDILKAVGEELGISECTRGEHCEREDYCVTTHIL
ncbi:MAG: Rrf2 family transcriptional regulator [Candidatus Peribacteria bacterium]|nr:MAG: Rrf2 family transcriptional regulator [Candidatus Peribacteria bacterium]